MSPTQCQHSPLPSPSLYMARTITQATFDAAVGENVREFGMGEHEALADAVAQFESQGG